MKITPTDIRTALVGRVRETFSKEPVYEDLTPRNFERPSSMVEVTRIDLDTQSFGRHGLGLRVQARITTFAEVDEVHNAHLPVLDLRAMLVLGAFAEGFLPVGDRALTVTDLTADTTLYDCAVVTLTLELAVDRGAYSPAELLPMMEELTLRVRTTKEEAST